METKMKTTEYRVISATQVGFECLIDELDEKIVMMIEQRDELNHNIPLYQEIVEQQREVVKSLNKLINVTSISHDDIEDSYDGHSERDSLDELIRKDKEEEDEFKKFLDFMRS